MKRAAILILAIIGILSANRTNGQTNKDIYLIGTSIVSSSDVTGLDRYSGNRNNPYSVDGYIGFTLRSVPQDYEISMYHLNKMRVKTITQGELATLPVTDLDALINSGISKEEAMELAGDLFMKGLSGTKIWLIDLSDFDTSSSSDQIVYRMIEVEISFLNFPTEPKYTIEYIEE